LRWIALEGEYYNPLTIKKIKFLQDYVEIWFLDETVSTCYYLKEEEEIKLKELINDIK